MTSTFLSSAFLAYRAEIADNEDPDNNFIVLAIRHADPILYRCQKYRRTTDDPIVSGYLFDPCGRENVLMIAREQKRMQTKIVSDFLLDFNISRMTYAVTISRLSALSSDERWLSHIATWAETKAIRDPLVHISIDATRRALGCAIVQSLARNLLTGYAKHSHGWIREVINERLREIANFFPDDIREAVDTYRDNTSVFLADLV